MLKFSRGAAAIIVAGCMILALDWTAIVSAQDAVGDARGVEVDIDDTTRIVSIGGSVTEIIYALGKQTHIVAIDTTSTFPEETQMLPNVGYMRALSPEGVLSTEPSLILAIDGAGPAETVDVLANASVPFVVVPNEQSLAGTIEKIRFIANIVGATERGEALIQEIEENAMLLESAKSGISDPKRVMFILSLRDGSVLAAGRGTSAEAIIELAGGRNAIQNFEGFKTVDAEGIILAAPDVILMMNRGDHATQSEEVFNIAAIAATPAGANRNFVAMDGLYLLGFGPRTPNAALELTENLYDISSTSE